MEVLETSFGGTPSISSGSLGGPAAAGTDESDGSKETANAVSRPRRGGEEESLQTPEAPCAGVRKTPSPRVLSHLLQFNAQRQHPPFPSTASAAAAVLLAFATAPIRMGSVRTATLSAPPSAAPSASPRASPAGETGSSCSVAAAPCSASAVTPTTDASLVAAAAARLAASAAAALTSESAIEPGLRRPFTIQEETQQQLIEEEEEDGGVAPPPTSLPGGTSAAADCTTAAAALRALEETCGRVPYDSVAVQRDEDIAHQEDGEAAATISAATPVEHPNAACTRGGAKGAEGGGELTKALTTGDGEAGAEEASISTEFVESCAVPWKPTCLTEISFDYSVPSTRGDGASASPLLYESQRSTASEPAESTPANRAAGALATAPAVSVSPSLSDRWPSCSLDPPQCGASGTRGAAARTPNRRQASINSDSDCAASATEGMPSNVSRWRLGRVTPHPQQKPQAEQQMMVQHMSHVGLQQQRSNEKDAFKLPLQQQLEAVLQQQEEEEKQNAARQEQGQRVMQRLLEQHLKSQLRLQAEQSEVHEQQHIETEALLQAMHTGDSLLQRTTQHKNMEEAPRQLQLKQPHQDQHQLDQQQLNQPQQQQPQTQDLLQHEHFKDAERFFTLVVQQLQQQQHGEEQQQDLVLRQHKIEHQTAEQTDLLQHHCGETAAFFQKHQHPLQMFQQKEDDKGLQQQQKQPSPMCADLLFAASLPDATTAVTAHAIQPPQREALPAEIATVTTVAGALAPATVSRPLESRKPLPSVVAAGDVLAAAAAAAAAAAGAAPADPTGTVGGAACRQRYTQRRCRRRKRKTSKGGRFVQTSSSGYPGVSWNRRMGAWLAFFYDTQSRRSRTFHPRYFNGDIEATRIAAIEFKKSMDRLFSCAPNKKDHKDSASLGPQQEDDGAQEEQPQDDEGTDELPQETREQEADLQQQRLKDVDLEHLPDKVSEWAASLLLPQQLKSQPSPEQQQEESWTPGGVGSENPEREGGSSSRQHTVVQYSSIGGGDSASDAVAKGRKRVREESAEEVGGAATVGCTVSACFTAPHPTSGTDLSSASHPPPIASTELLSLGGDAEASCTNGADATEQSAAPAGEAAPDADTVHEELAVNAALPIPVWDDSERGNGAAAVPLQASSAGSTTTAASASSPLSVDLSVLAAMGSPERLQQVLSFGTDLPGTSARRLAFSWSRLSTLSTENMNVLYRSSKSNLQPLGQGAGAVCPAAGGAAGAAAEDAAKEGHKAAAPTIRQLLRLAQGEEEEKEDEQSLSIPSLLQQLQLSEGVAGTSISSSGVHFDDAALLREGGEELHQILEQSYGLLSFRESYAYAALQAFLWSGELRFPGSKEADPEATTRSRLQDGSSSTTRKEPSVACSGSSGTDTTTGSASCSSNPSGSKNNNHYEDGTNSTDTASQSSGDIATNGSTRKTGTESTVAAPSVKSGESYNEDADEDARTSSLEKICRLLGEGAKESAGEGKHATNNRASCLPFLAHAQYTIGGNLFADTTSEKLLKQAVDAFQLNRWKSGVGGGPDVARATCQRSSSNINSNTTHEEAL